MSLLTLHFKIFLQHCELTTAVSGPACTEQHVASSMWWWHVEQQTWESPISFYSFLCNGAAAECGHGEEWRGGECVSHSGLAVKPRLPPQCTSDRVAMWRLSGEQAVFKMSGWWAQLFTIQFVLICDSEFINLAHGSHFKFQFGLNACSDWGHIGKNKTI